MKKITHPHDSFVKLALSDIKTAQVLLKRYLSPKLTKAIDFKTLESVKTSFIDTKFAKLESDVVFKATIKNKPGYLYLLVEHQTTPDPMMPFRLVKYISRVIEQHQENHPNDKKLPFPVIAPIILYNGKKPYLCSTNFFDLFGDQAEFMRELFNDGFELLDLSTIPDEKLKADLWSKLTFYIMKHIHQPDILIYLEQIKESLSASERYKDGKLLIGMITYIMSAGTMSDDNKLEDILKETVSIEARAEIMTYAQRAELRGEERGRELERQQLLTKLINSGIPANQVASILEISEEEIQTLTTPLE